MREIKVLIFLLFFISSFVGFFEGGEAADRHGECSYPSLASYYPPRFLACQLFKKRWSEK